MGPPIIFLDVDGVLHPLNEKHLPRDACLSDLVARADEQEYPNLPTRVCLGEFCSPNLSALRLLVASTGADIVLSSTWRQTAGGRMAVSEQLVKHGVTSRPIDAFTPVLVSGRASEVEAYVERHAMEASPFIVLDDEDLTSSTFLKEGENYIKVDPSEFLHSRVVSPLASFPFLARSPCPPRSFPTGKGLTEADAALAIAILSRKTKSSS